MNPITPLLIATIISPADNALWQLSPLAYRNPAVKQWMLPQTYNALSGGWGKERAGEATCVPGEGTGADGWGAGADSFVKQARQSLWGAASYRNGTLRDMRWNETSDASLVAPYFTADSIGGDLALERYAFSGGFGETRGRLAWGVSASYEAGLYYRNVDPRPKNVTGKLDLRLGAGALLGEGGYFLGAGAGWYKYKQSNEIDFKSQTGVEKIYHLTGLGTHYSRFAGTGLDAYYTGSCPSVSVNLYPTRGRGLTASLAASRLELDKVLSDLNKLPLAKIVDKEIEGEIGWRGASSASMASSGASSSEVAFSSIASSSEEGVVQEWGLTLSAKLNRRHGIENTFGDAASSIYPQIGSLWMYADNSRSLAIEGLWQVVGIKSASKGTASATLNENSNKSGDVVARESGAAFIFWLRPALSYDHRTIAYRDPARFTTTNTLTASLRTMLTLRLTARWSGSLEGAVALTSPFDCAMDLGSTSTAAASSTLASSEDAETSDLTGLLNAVEQSYLYAAGRRQNYEAALRLSRTLSARYALTARVAWEGTHYYNATTRRALSLSLALRF